MRWFTQTDLIRVTQMIWVFRRNIWKFVLDTWTKSSCTSPELWKCNALAMRLLIKSSGLILWQIWNTNGDINEITDVFFSGETSEKKETESICCLWEIIELDTEQNRSHLWLIFLSHGKTCKRKRSLSELEHFSSDFSLTKWSGCLGETSESLYLRLELKTHLCLRWDVKVQRMSDAVMKKVLWVLANLKPKRRTQAETCSLIRQI